MADSGLDLLFRLKASNQATPAIKSVQADVAKLRQTFGADFNAMKAVSTTAISSITSSLSGLTGHVPVLGGVLNNLTSEMDSTAGATTQVGIAIARMGGPVGVAVAVLAAMAGAAVLVTKEILELTKRSAEFQGKMFDLAQQTGLTVETLSTLEVVAKTTGGELGSITQAIVLFQRKLDDAQDPLSKTAELFRKFSIETTDTEASLRSTFAALAQMPEGFAQTNAAAEFFGARGGKQVLAILKETNGDLDATTKRLRELGVLISEETARAADKFNDELALLDFQLRAMGATVVKDLIPVMVDLIRSFSELVSAVRPLLGLLGSIAGPFVRSVTGAFRSISIAVLALTGDYKGLAKAIKEAREEGEIKPLSVPGPAPVPLSGAPTGQQTASDSVNEANAVIAAVKRQVAEHAAAIDGLAQKGRLTREQQAKETIADNKKILDADRQRIDALLKQKEQEILALDEAQKNRGEVVRRDTDAYRTVTAEIGKLQQERLDKESEFEVSSTAIRNKAAKERADSKRNDIRNESDLLANEFDRQIKEIEAQIKRGATVEATGLAIIEQLEQAKIDTRIEFLQKQKEVGFLTIQDLADLNNELQKLNQERDRLADEQGARRLERERSLSQQLAAITIGSIETLLQLQQIAGERLIASTQALADRRVITEEAAARKILQIRLDLIDAETAATSEKLKATSTIADKGERETAQADLNNQIKILTQQRITIESEGNRAIDDARQEDLESARRYVDELQEINQRITDIERDTAEEGIRLMVLHFARRTDIIRAQADLDIKDAEERHRRNQADINRQKATVRERIASIDSQIKSLESAGKHESRIYENAVNAHISALAQQEQLNDQERASLTQHQAILTALRSQNVIQDYQRAIQARVTALEKQKDLNADEQQELTQHQAILQSLRERETRSDRAGIIQARISVLQQQKTLNSEERDELARHQTELKSIRESEDLGNVIERRIAVLTQQKQINTQEQTELRNHYAVLAAIRGRAGLDIYAKEIEGRVGALQKQRDLNKQEQEELRQNQAILLSIRQQAVRDSRAIEIQGRIDVLGQQKILNQDEKDELQRHQAELKQIREQGGDLQSVVQKRVDFLRAQTVLNEGERAELERHEATLKTIRGTGQSFESAIRARIEFLESQKTLNDQEREELKQHRALVATIEDRGKIYQNAIDQRIAFLEQQKALNDQELAELARLQKEKEVITKQEKTDKRAASPLGQFDLGTDQLKEFAATVEQSVVPLADILTDAFFQVADAIGSVVSQWVLLGETGPAVMRKILAQALASIAAEAAVNAVKMLAVGFAELAFGNFAAAGSAFTSAAIWGGIAGVAAVAGRGVAGDLFKKKDSDRDKSSKGSSDALQTIVQGRNQPQPVNVTINLKGDDSKMASFITASVVRNIGDGGEIREVIHGDGRAG